MKIFRMASHLLGVAPILNFDKSKFPSFCSGVWAGGLCSHRGIRGRGSAAGVPDSGQEAAFVPGFVGAGAYLPL